MKLLSAIAAGVILAVLFFIGLSVWRDGDPCDSIMGED